MNKLYVTMLLLATWCLVSCHCSELIRSDSERENVFTPRTSMGPTRFDLNGTLAVPDPPDGCYAPTNAEELSNRIVVVLSDYCYPYTKAKNMQDAGASGVLLIGYRNTEGLLIYYNGGGDEKDIVVPVLEISRSDRAKIEDDTLVVMIADPNPFEEFGEIPWMLYSIAYFAFAIITAMYALSKIISFVSTMEGKIPRLPIMVLGTIVLTCIHPIGSRDVYSWGMVELLITLDFSFAIITALIIAFHWDAEIHLATDRISFTLMKWKYKVPGFIICGVLATLEVASSVMRGLLMPAKAFLMAKAFSYALVSFSVGVYLIIVGWKIRKILGGRGSKLKKNFRTKMYITLGISASLIAFAIVAMLVPSPLYAKPAGFCALNFLAGVFPHIAVVLQIPLFEPKRSIKSTGSQKKTSKRSGAASEREDANDDDLELNEP